MPATAFLPTTAHEVGDASLFPGRHFARLALVSDTNLIISFNYVDGGTKDGKRAYQGEEMIGIGSNAEAMTWT